MSTCPRCSGKGNINCPSCDGKGRKYIVPLLGFGAFNCSGCNGLGDINCPDCEGLDELDRPVNHRYNN
jgi:DnaJ-class molecular chaperone